MKKFLPIAVIVGLLAIVGLIIGVWYMKVNNNAMGFNQAVEKEWGDVETAYQRRNDLIGNLVETVKGAAAHEQNTLTAVVEARAKATSVQVDPTNMTPEKLAEYQEAQSGVSSALSRLLVTVEAYPQLQANQNFLKLQDELASTENQILTSRNRFNEAVKNYNTYVLTMPNNLVLGKYKERPFFKSEAGAEKAPNVKF